MRDDRELPAFRHTHQLTLAVHEATRLIAAGDPGLTARLRATALSASGAVVRGNGLPARRFAGELAHAAARLREVAYYIDFARHLGQLDLGTAAELLACQSRASLEVEALARSLVEEELERTQPILAIGGVRLEARR